MMIDDSQQIIDDQQERDKEDEKASKMSDQSFDILKQISQEIKDDPLPMLDNCLKQNLGTGTRGRPPMDLMSMIGPSKPSKVKSAQPNNSIVK